MRKHHLVVAAAALAAVVPALAAASAMHAYAIVDPALKMTAWTLDVPVGWKVDGTVLPPPSCTSGSTPVYKATSADGTMASYFLPQVAWTWGAAARPSSDCQGWTGAVSASTFLNYQLAAEKIGYVGALTPEPKPNLPGYTTDSARDLARYVVGNREYDAVVSAVIMCHARSMPALQSCNALVQRWDGPKGTVVPNIPMFRAMRLTQNPAWLSAWTDAMRRRLQGMYGPETQTLLRQGDLAQAARMQEHNAFMASQQKAADQRSIAFNAHENQKQSNTDNFVDYVLDCSRAYSGGGTVRVSSASCPNRQTF